MDKEFSRGRGIAFETGEVRFAVIKTTRHPPASQVNANDTTTDVDSQSTLDAELPSRYHFRLFEEAIIVCEGVDACSGPSLRRPRCGPGKPS